MKTLCIISLTMTVTDQNQEGALLKFSPHNQDLRRRSLEIPLPHSKTRHDVGYPSCVILTWFCYSFLMLCHSKCLPDLYGSWHPAHRFWFDKAPANKLVSATSFLWALYKSRDYDYDFRSSSALRPTLLRPSIPSSLKFANRSIAIGPILLSRQFGINFRQNYEKYLTHHTNSPKLHLLLFLLRSFTPNWKLYFFTNYIGYILSSVLLHFLVASTTNSTSLSRLPVFLPDLPVCDPCTPIWIWKLT